MKAGLEDDLDGLVELLTVEKIPECPWVDEPTQEMLVRAVALSWFEQRLAPRPKPGRWEQRKAGALPTSAHEALRRGW